MPSNWEPVLSTLTIAQRLVDYCRQGRFETAVTELYGDAIVSQEMPGTPDERVEGLDSVREKAANWKAGVQQFHGCDVSDPVVAGEFFTVKMSLDVTFHGAPRTRLDELCVYRVADGKIVHEQFFYSVPSG